MYAFLKLLKLAGQPYYSALEAFKVNPTWQSNVALVFQNIGSANYAIGRLEDAVHAFEECARSARLHVIAACLTDNAAGSRHRTICASRTYSSCAKPLPQSNRSCS